MADWPRSDEWVRRMTTAAAQLLFGKGGDIRGGACNAGLALIVGGGLGPTGSLWLGSVARRQGRHIVHLGFSAAGRGVPDVTLIHRRRQMFTAYEGCLFWAGDDGGPVSIVQFEEAVAFQLSSRGSLRCARAPTTSFEAEMEGHARAVERLHRLAIDSDEALLCLPSHPSRAGEGR